jgi:LmbE family N-acetylglucosaminyl deacetylase
MRSRVLIALLLALACLADLSQPVTLAQVRPVYDIGALGLGQLVRRLNTSASVMMIGAHPDDEDTALLAYLARGENARTAYLSLTRGDGGQNLIGPELGEGLGVIRTEELLQARRLDGAEQYFTRAYDYGFSKTLDEAKAKWNEKVVLCDVVRAIRRFRPLVVVAQFTGTPIDGHGQHQFAGYITPLAVRAAADIGQCESAGSTWAVKKVYVRHRGPGDAGLRINTGKYDPLFGRSYFEIAMQARSLHRSQDQGVLELRGDQFSGIDLLDKAGPEASIFDGVDISIGGIAENTGNSEAQFRKRLVELAAVVNQISTAYEPLVPEKLVPLLMDGYKAAYDAEWSTRNPNSKAFLVEKQRQLLLAIENAGGIRIDALGDRETVVPGEKLSVAVKTFLPGDSAVKVTDVDLKLPSGWTATSADAPKESQGFRRELATEARYFTVQVPATARPTVPYWLEATRERDLFQWPSGDPGGLPFQAPPAVARIKLGIGPREVVLTRPIEFRFADDVRGEVRRELNVVPRVSVGLGNPLIVTPTTGSAPPQTVSVTVTNNSTLTAADGTLSLTVPAGWKCEPTVVNFSLPAGKRTATPFRLVPSPKVTPGDYSLDAIAAVSNERFESTMRVLSYLHIQTHRYYTPSTGRIAAIDVETVPVTVGYIEGSGDEVTKAISQLGSKVTMLDATELAAGDLSRFDVIFVGVRAAQVRPDFIENHGRLMDYVRAGGTVVVQYQPPAYQSMLPYPAKIGPRVADENAPVGILLPEHSILSYPNKIGLSDFDGWVQERNLNDLTEMAADYTPLLESHDPGEPENKGGLVVAKVGRGNFVYCSYALFRQLPAGVPGGYRLLANLLSIPKTVKKP